MFTLQGLGVILASLPPLLEGAAIRVDKKRKREAEVGALVARKKCHLQRKREKKVARLACARPRGASPCLLVKRT